MAVGLLRGQKGNGINFPLLSRNFLPFRVQSRYYVGRIISLVWIYTYIYTRRTLGLILLHLHFQRAYIGIHRFVYIIINISPSTAAGSAI